jgi:hypothetical protein
MHKLSANPGYELNKFINLCALHQALYALGGSKRQWHPHHGTISLQNKTVMPKTLNYKPSYLNHKKPTAMKLIKRLFTHLHARYLLRVWDQESRSEGRQGGGKKGEMGRRRGFWKGTKVKSCWTK